MKGQKIIIGLLVFILTISGMVGCAKEISFEEAMKKPELRESYIEKIVKKIGKPDYVKEINYVNTPAEFEFLKEFHGYVPEPTLLMQTNPIKEIPIAQIGKLPCPVRISIFPYSFSGEVLKVENDFMSSLLHEYHHAQVLNQPKIDSIDYQDFLIVGGKLKGRWNLALINTVMELTSIRETLHSPLKISPEYRCQRENFYLDNYLSIWDYEEGMNPEFIKSLKIDFFDDWLAEGIKEKMRAEGIEYLDYLENSKTGKRYHLPKEIIDNLTRNGKG